MDLPEGVQVRTYIPDGQMMPDDVGLLIEAGDYAGAEALWNTIYAAKRGPWTPIIHEGSGTLRNYTITPPRQLTIKSASITTDERILLQQFVDSLSPGCYDFAMCMK